MFGGLFRSSKAKSMLGKYLAFKLHDNKTPLFSSLYWPSNIAISSDKRPHTAVHFSSELNNPKGAEGPDLHKASRLTYLPCFLVQSVPDT